MTPQRGAKEPDRLLSNSSKPFNPFYPLLVVVGVIFCVTACAYGVMTVKGLQPDVATAAGTVSDQQLLVWLDVNGFKMMMIELAVLAVMTVAAISTDEYWERRNRDPLPRSGEVNEPPRRDSPHPFPHDPLPRLGEESPPQADR